MVNRIDELNFEFYLILLNFNLSGHMCLVATILDRAGLEPGL